MGRIRFCIAVFAALVFSGAATADEEFDRDAVKRCVENQGTFDKRLGACIWTVEKPLPSDAAAEEEERRAWETVNRCLESRGTTDEIVESCTWSIEHGSRRMRTGAYFHRGNAWRAKGEHQRAVGDYDDAIRLDPDNVAAHFNRGNSYLDLGNFDRAIESYDSAIELNPTMPQFHSNRASAWIRKADYGRAAEGFSNAIRLSPKESRLYSNRAYSYFALGLFDAAAKDLTYLRSAELTNNYWWLWEYIARGRAGRVEPSGLAGLAAAAADVDLTKWPGPIVGAVLDKISNDDLFRAAARLSSPTEGYQCQLPFYIGEIFLVAGVNGNNAKLFLKNAVQACKPSSWEYMGAVTELERLGP